MIRRLLSLLLVLALAGSCFPAGAFAEEIVLTEIEETELPQIQESQTAETVQTLPAETETAAELPAEDADMAVPVSFVCTPDQVKILVQDQEGNVLPAEADGTFLLVPGTYTYRAECDGYAPAEETGFTVEAQPVEIVITLQPLELVSETEETAPAAEQQETVSPIIVVPGIMGSRLYKDPSCSSESMVWGSVNAIFDTGSQNGAAVRIENTLYVNGNDGLFLETESQREYGTIDIYKNLVDFLCSTYPDRAVYFYSYDWRRSNADSAQILHRALENQGIEKAIFIGHSMGGLVLSNYISEFSAEAAEKIITLGTPYEGATRLMEAVLTSKVLTGIAGAGNALLEKGGLTYDIKRNLLGVAELSPNVLYLQNVDTENRCYYELADEANVLQLDLAAAGAEAFENLDSLKAWINAPFAADAAQKQEKGAAKQWLEALETAYGLRGERLTEITSREEGNMLKITPVRQIPYSYEDVLRQIYPAYDSIVSVQNSVQKGIWQLYGMPNAYFAIGDSINTMSGITMVSKDGKLYPQMYDYLSVGDGTVPFISANMLQGTALSRARYFDLEHNELSGYSGKAEWTKVKNWMRSIIEDTVIDNSGRSNPRASKGMIVIRVDAAADVSVKWGSETLATKLKGVQINTGDGIVHLVNYDTSFGTLDFAGEDGQVKIFCLDPNDGYEITIEGLEESRMDYSIRFYDENDTLLEERYAVDVPVTENTIIATGTDRSAPITLSVDADGDKQTDNEYLLTNLDGSDKPVHLVQEYILLAQGQTETADLILSPEALAAHVQWAATDADGICFEGDPVITVDAATGEITAHKEGTAYVVAYLENGSNLFWARCRVDVTQPEEGQAASVTSKIKTVSLPVDKVSVELYQTEYTRFDVLPELDQLVNAYSASGLVPESELPESVDGGIAIEEAAFADPQVAAVFDLNVVDDRTLEIIPKYSVLEAAWEKASSVKASYKSAVRLVIDGEEYITSDSSGKEKQLMLTVKKTLPKLKAGTLEFLSAVDGQLQTLSFGDVQVAAIEKDLLNSEKNSKTDASAWLDVNYETGEVSLKAGAVPQKTGKLYLTLTLEGWAVKQNVAVTVKTSATVPKLTLKPASATVLSGSYDRAELLYQITPAQFVGQIPQITRITEGTGKNLKTYANGEVISCECTEDRVIIGAVRVPEDGKTHTYKVYLTLAGKEYSFSVKVLPPGTKVTASVKSSGSINTGVQNSPLTLTVSMKNYHPESVRQYDLEIRQYKAATKSTAAVDRIVTDLFDITMDGNIFTLTEARQGTLESGYTYYAYISADIGAETRVEAAKVKLSIKWGDPAKLPVSVKLKAAGTIDTIRPGTSITLTPTIKNYYGYTLKPEDISFYRTYKTKENGKTVTVKDEYAPDYFDVTVKNGQYQVSLKPGAALASSDSFKAAARITIDGNSYTSPLCSIKLTTGKAKITAEPASVTLLLKDRYSSERFSLKTTDDTLAEISHITMDAASAQYFAITDHGHGTYEIAFKDHQIPKGLKTGRKTVKLNVYLEGAPEDKVCATVSVAVQVK